ncbi:prolipoprotein diacylglyceryl transferase [bacterium (Candidatus Blackallbacteria) CG17_big_fil_post_rev_8_21_14_2_50_48_46]|uniref:Phosphatidylglycerol--prolipoprotein diacylglyceryl transferase n=1 Tax=bacterium (Candidatus Blackallbacteria) CG17_big_fil_post_rev_8_21_14_2_50_48_46 TaxID=2014261 RepID=A0A2M7G2Y9_9BACT|nr:MAG: prolipoprotein diacylglyceryl transferase [bacterium (Candidatus Blackallbacteria) CG18_big_fil_WC_8_21_14_2_50_49_26]PIW16095.1 MAG: prolipoprotein diacylglyceryl transferase [bacterium (Candidatus Blackallbacteria) CG17_big_fil_post_rev_8_21_14_2_50_48_46]PIW50507.1 MAG: prolipoprotein diacylglyceryl transferase [bacterium (Candidatus Blackallbacteria) CG13_big_fil_rev_8_21_14_2_50_49_14]
MYTHNLNPVIFKIGPLEPRWYAMMYLLGFALTYLLISRNPRYLEMGFNRDDAMDFLTYAFFGVILGGRLGYVLFYNLPMYLKKPWEILMVWQGGMSFHGGLIGSILAIVIYARMKKIPLARMLDIVAVPAPLGLGLGRIGNFINGELWGKPTGGNWGVIFNATGGGNIPRHPTQLYEAGLEGFLLFAVLWLVFRTAKNLKDGSLGGIFLLGYGLARSVIEFTRIPDPQLGYLYGGWLTMGMLLCLPMILGGLLMLIFFNLQKSKPETVALSSDGVPTEPPAASESAS